MHSGTLVDACTCCKSRYCLSIEEQQTSLTKDNSVPARIKRLVKGAKACGKWHTVHVDRGYATVAVGEALRKVRCHYNINIPLNRVGLPRAAMATATAEMNEKWEWVAWHKGNMELLAWNDGDAVYFISDKLSSAKVGLLKRCTKNAEKAFFVEVPEMSFAYNV